MPISLKKVCTALGVGAVDNVLVELEERGSITGNMTYVKDAIRVLGVVGGYAMDVMGFETEIADALFTSCLPLTMHTIRTRIKELMAKPVAKMRLSPPPAQPRTSAPAQAQSGPAAPLIVSY